MNNFYQLYDLDKVSRRNSKIEWHFLQKQLDSYTILCYTNKYRDGFFVSFPQLHPTSKYGNVIDFYSMQKSKTPSVF